MSFLKTVATTLVAGSLVAAPIAAQAAAPADRDATDVEGESFRGGWIVPLLALAAVILGIVVLVSDDDEGSLPTSP